MFKGSDGYAATIGKPGRVVTVAEVEDPYLSKIGGMPSWHDEGSAPREALRCRQCGNADRMLMVCQIYAPTDRPRSIYVFCCNRRRCSLSSLGWIVLRNQAKSAPTPSSSSVASIAPSSAVAAAAVPAPTGSVWDFLGAETSAPASLCASTTAPATQPDIGRLEKLLRERDAPSQSQQQQQQSKQEPSTSRAIKAGSADVPSIVALAWRPCRRIIEIEDSWIGRALGEEHTAKIKGSGRGGGGDEGDETGDDADEDEDEDEDEDYFTTSAASDAHIQRMLQGYLADDPDEELSKMLSDSADKAAGGASRKSTTSASTDASRGSSKGKGKVDDADGAGWVKKLARNTLVSKTEQYFQRRTAPEPQQVLRYAYGGQPLWCTHPPPFVPSPVATKGARSRSSSHSHTHGKGAEGTPPGVCKSCGATRVFELQLMPALLTQELKAVPLAEAALPLTAPSDVAAPDPDSGIVARGTDPLSQSTASSDVDAKVDTTPVFDASVDEDGSVDNGRADDGKEEEDEETSATPYAKPSVSQVASLLERLGDELDFGVVTVWCCPNSCEEGKEEEAIVQQPCDITST